MAHFFALPNTNTVFYRSVRFSNHLEAILASLNFLVVRAIKKGNVPCQNKGEGYLL